MLKSVLHIIVILLLTLVTQVGGVIWILVFGIVHFKFKSVSLIKKVFSFLLIYTVSVLLLVPLLAGLSGRTPLPITKSGHLVPHTYLTVFFNRHYVTHDFKTRLEKASSLMPEENNLLKVSYLDANFPFFDGFPLLPHLSHNDGKKVDLAFYYLDEGQVSNSKPSNTGYGVFVVAKNSGEVQSRRCKTKGYWQYDLTKYLTLGSRDGLTFDEKNTKKLVNIIVSDSKVEKIFIEPHLKSRLGLSDSRVRFQGCHSVRHDDHIHVQIN